MDYTIIVALATLVISVIVGLATRRKLDSESANEISEAAMSLLQPFRDRLAELDKRVTSQAVQITQLQTHIETLQTENAKLWQGVTVLSEQILELGHLPRFQPPPALGGEEYHG